MNMREYAKVSPQFWIGPTGRKIRKLGIQTQHVALYLITSPHATMMGIYYLPVVFIAHETGLSLKKASKALQALCDIHFCSYDHDSEYVWVQEMAFYQISEQLKPSDNRVKSINESYHSLPDLPFLKDFFDKYHQALCLKGARENVYPIDAALDLTNTPLDLTNTPSNPLRRGSNDDEDVQEKSKENEIKAISQESRINFVQDSESPHFEPQIEVFLCPKEAPSKALRSQEQEQEQKQEQEQQQQQEQEQKQKQEEIIVAQDARRLPNDQIEIVFNYWKTTMQHPKAQLDDKRKKIISKALRSGYSVEELCEAITGCSQTPHNCGVNEQGQRYDGLHVILRDADQIDRFITNAHHPPSSRNETERQSQGNVSILQGWLSKHREEKIL